jgi:tricorn protease
VKGVLLFCRPTPKKSVYTRRSVVPYWKRYKADVQPDLWIYICKTIPRNRLDFAGTDQLQPGQDKIYFASDRDLKLNIYSYDTKTKEVKQLTKYTDFDVMWPSGENGQLVFENGGYLYKMNLETGVTEKVTVNINFDNPNLVPYYKKVADDVQSANVSPTGKRALFEARGDIFSVPAENGITENLTQTQGVREIYRAGRPMGSIFRIISDATGEYEIYLLENKKGANPGS